MIGYYSIIIYITEEKQDPASGQSPGWLPQRKLSERLSYPHLRCVGGFSPAVTVLELMINNHGS